MKTVARREISSIALSCACQSLIQRDLDPDFVGELLNQPDLLLHVPRRARIRAVAEQEELARRNLAANEVVEFGVVAEAL